MIKKVEITDCHDTNVHWEGTGEFTLCGLEALDGDPGIGLGAAKETRKKVDCQTCLDIVDHVRHILKK